MHFWPKFGNTDFNWWWLFARTSSKWGKFWLLSWIWPWSSRSIVQKNNRDLNQGLLHLWSKFGDSSLNGWWVIARTSWWLTDRHTHTHTHDNTRRPKLASGKNYCGPLHHEGNKTIRVLTWIPVFNGEELQQPEPLKCQEIMVHANILSNL